MNAAERSLKGDLGFESKNFALLMARRARHLVIALEDLTRCIFDDGALEESGVHPAMEFDCVVADEVLEVPW